MRYGSGEPVRLGDTVTMGAAQSGVVVGIIEDGVYAAGYREGDWAYLHSGLLLSTEFGDLRLDGPDEDLELVSRSASPPTRFLSFGSGPG